MPRLTMTKIHINPLASAHPKWMLVCQPAENAPQITVLSCFIKKVEKKTEKDFKRQKEEKQIFNTPNKEAA